MAYVDGMVAAVPVEMKDAYVEHARVANAVFREHGATRCTDCWGDDVPHGQTTDFYRAVQAKPGEVVVFSWVEWPDKATRDTGMQKAMEDTRLSTLEFPVNGKLMIYGGFVPVVEV